MPVGDAERSKHIRELQVVNIKECIIPNFAFLCSFFSSSTNCSNWRFSASGQCIQSFEALSWHLFVAERPGWGTRAAAFSRSPPLSGHCPFAAYCLWAFGLSVSSHSLGFWLPAEPLRYAPGSFPTWRNGRSAGGCVSDSSCWLACRDPSTVYGSRAKRHPNSALCPIHTSKIRIQTTVYKCTSTVVAVVLNLFWCNTCACWLPELRTLG